MCVKNTMISMMLVALVLAAALVLPAGAAAPAHTGVSYPATFWSTIGKTNTVTGKVILSSGVSHSIEGAYVAIVNASNPDVEYANTTSAADGSYSFTDVSATHFQNADPFTDPQYMIYAYKQPYGEAYSTNFGVDAAALSAPLEVWVVMPVSGKDAPDNGISSATVQATVAPSPSVAPTPTPPNGGWSLQSIAIILVVIFLVLAGAGAYLYIRRR